MEGYFYVYTIYIVYNVRKSGVHIKLFQFLH